MVNGVLYTTVGSRRAAMELDPETLVALDAQTGGRIQSFGDDFGNDTWLERTCRTVSPGGTFGSLANSTR